LQPISTKEYAQLSSIQLAERIDRFFQEDAQNRYAHPIPTNRVLATKVCKSVTLGKLPESDRKRALSFFFRSQFQTALCLQFGAFQNQAVHLQDQSEMKWVNPVVQIRNAAARQAQIVASRISFECLMEFVYFVSNTKTIKAKRSKFNEFRKWICEGGHNFGWLIFYLATVKRFDEQHRTPEVHGMSYIADDAMRCEVWPHLNSELDLANLCLNIWGPILQTLDGQEVNSGFVFLSETYPISQLVNWRNLDLNKTWEEVSSSVTPPSTTQQTPAPPPAPSLLTDR
jgi:hypothetical protein